VPAQKPAKGFHRVRVIAEDPSSGNTSSRTWSFTVVH